MRAFRFVLAAALLLAGCQAPAPTTGRWVQARVGASGKLQLTVRPDHAPGYHVQHLLDLHWTVAEATLTNPSLNLEPRTLRANAELDALTGERVARLDFGDLTVGTGYALSVSFRRPGPDEVELVVASGLAASLAVGEGLTTLALAIAPSAAAQVLAPPPTSAMPRPYVTSLFFGPPVRFDGPEAVAVAADGTVYVADRLNNRIRKVAPNGATSTLAGGEPGSADGEGLRAGFSGPSGVVLAPNGDLIVADSGNRAIRRVTPQGVVTTLTAPDAELFQVTALAMAGDTLYIADFDDDNPFERKCRISTMPLAGGPVTRLVGGPAGGLDGSFEAASFDLIRGLALTPEGDLLAADTGNNRIRRLRLATGQVETLAGDLDNVAGLVNGQGSGARFDAPRGLAVDAAGTVYVADAGNHAVRRISASGEVSTHAGGTAGYRDGPGDQAAFANPHGLALDASGRLVVADADDAASPSGAYIRLVAPDRAVSTLAGTASVGWLDGERSAGYFAGPVELTLDTAGNLYVADTRHNRIMLATPDGSVSVLAGTGERGAQDGPGATASFGEPEGLLVDERNPAQPRLLVSDTYNHKIRQIDLADPAHSVTTLAGGGNPGNGEFDGGYVNGSGLTARFKGPTGLAIDATTSTLLIGDHNNHRIRKMLLDDPDHTVSNFVGNGFIGHINGQGVFVSLAFPHALLLDPAGVLYVPDHDWNDIRRIQADGTVSDILEADDVQAMADGPNGKLGHPMGIALDRDGKLVVGDTWNHAIRLVDVSNPAQPVVTTLAGTGSEGFLDGPAATARFRNPQGVRVDAQGNVYVADSGNSCIRKIVR